MGKTARVRGREFVSEEGYLRSEMDRVCSGNIIRTAAETRDEICRLCHRLSSLSAACYGPHGTCAVVRNEAAHGHMTVTSSAARIFQHTLFPASSLTAQLIRESVRRLANDFGDCGHFCVLLATRLVLSTIGDHRHLGDGLASVPRRVVLAGNQIALKWTLEYLRSPACPLNVSLSWDAPDKICQMLQCLLQTKTASQLDDACELLAVKTERAPRKSPAGYLSHLLLTAFLNSLAVDEESQALRPNVHVFCADSTALTMDTFEPNQCDSGPTVATAKHQLLCNSVLLDIPLAPDVEDGIAACSKQQQQQQQLKFARGSGIHVGEIRPPLLVVLYNVSLRTPDLASDTGMQIQSGFARDKFNAPGWAASNADATAPGSSQQQDGGRWSAGDVERSLLQRIGDNIVNLGVHVVASQRLIHPWLKCFLLERGIVPLERLSIRHVGLFRCVTGCAVIGDWTQTLYPNMLGACRVVKTVRIGRNKRLVQVDGFSTEYLKATAQKQQLLLQQLQTGPAAAEAPSSIRQQIGWALQQSWTSRRRDVSVVILRAMDDVAAAELENSVKHCVTVLTNLVQDSVVIAGAGACEVHIASHLRRCVEQLKSNESIVAGENSRKGAALGDTKWSRVGARNLRRAVLNFAACLEAIPHSLSHRRSAGFCPTFEVLEALKAANKATLGPAADESNLGSFESTAGTHSANGSPVFQIWGFDVTSQVAVPVLQYRNIRRSPLPGDDPYAEREVEDLGVVDMRAAKIAALEQAVSVANTLLKVGGVVARREHK